MRLYFSFSSLPEVRELSQIRRDKALRMCQAQLGIFQLGSIFILTLIPLFAVSAVLGWLEFSGTGIIIALLSAIITMQIRVAQLRPRLREYVSQMPIDVSEDDPDEPTL